MSVEAWAVIGVGVAVIAFLAGIRRDLNALARDMADLRERLARIEGLLEGWLRREAWRGPEPPEVGS